MSSTLIPVGGCRGKLTLELDNGQRVAVTGWVTDRSEVEFREHTDSVQVSARERLATLKEQTVTVSAVFELWQDDRLDLTAGRVVAS